jgi:hypothetical protein
MISGLSSPTLSLVSASINLTTTGDKVTFPVPFKMEVYRIAIALNAAPGDAGVVTFDKRVTVGSDTGRLDAGVGTINLATSHAAGNVVFKDLVTRVNLVEGDEIVVEVTDASASASACYAIVLYREVPEVPGNNSDMKATT